MPGLKTRIMATCMLLCAAAATTHADAALSGYWDSSKILHAILGRSDLADELKQQRVETITATKSGYEVKSRDCTVEVVVERKLPDRPGPTSFAIHVGQATCR